MFWIDPPPEVQLPHPALWPVTPPRFPWPATAAPNDQVLAEIAELRKDIAGLRAQISELVRSSNG